VTVRRANPPRCGPRSQPNAAPLSDSRPQAEIFTPGSYNHQCSYWDFLATSRDPSHD